MKSIGSSKNQTIIKRGWGSRGNDKFWDLINEALGIEVIETKEELVAMIKRLHRNITDGVELTKDSRAYAPLFAAGHGMGDGLIDGRFWMGENFSAIDKIAEYLDLK